MVTKRSRRTLALLSIAIGVCVSALLAEALLRVAGVSYPRPYQRDTNRGTSYRPGITFRADGEGGPRVITTNAEGFRGPSYPIARRPHTVRIAVLGDSYVDATGVAVEDRFTDRIAVELAGRPELRGRAVEVLTFGMPGYGTAQELQMLRHHVAKYAPDVVVLAFLPFNDVRNNYKPLEGDDGKPYFLLRDGKLVLDDSFRSVPDLTKSFLGRLVYWAVDHVRLVQVAYQARRNWVRGFPQGSRGLAQAQGFVEYGLQTAAFIPPPDALWTEAWQVTEALILQMNREVHELGASFLVVVLTAGIQVDPDRELRRSAERALGVDNLFYAERRVCTLCEKEGIACLGLGEPFQAYATKTGTYLHGFPNTSIGRGHWNETGNALASEAIAQALIDRTLLPH